MTVVPLLVESDEAELSLLLLQAVNARASPAVKRLRNLFFSIVKGFVPVSVYKNCTGGMVTEDTEETRRTRSWSRDLYLSVS